jgi:hypothetical protein
LRHQRTRFQEENGGKNTNKLPVGFAVIAVLALSMAFVLPAQGTVIVSYGSQVLSGGSDGGNFGNVWDLSASNLTIRFTYNASGLSDAAGAHALGELGARDLSSDSNFNPNDGVWFAADYDNATGTFGPDAPNSIFDQDDKLMLQKKSGGNESDYDLPSVPPTPESNHRFWFDRDGVNASKASSPLAVDGATYNTCGLYNITIVLNATSATSGKAFMSVNGLWQGFETDGNSSTMELSPAGLSFTADIKHLQVFFGINGTGAPSTVAFNNITVEGTLFRLTSHVVPEVPLGAVAAVAVMIVALVVFGVGRRRNRD